VNTCAGSLSCLLGVPPWLLFVLWICAIAVCAGVLVIWHVIDEAVEHDERFR